jgi:hypothetical protein
MTANYEPRHGWGPNLEDFIKPGQTVWPDGYAQEIPWDQSCVVCARKVNPGRGVWICVGAGGSVMIHPDDITEAEDADPGFMGHVLVGPECGKTIPTEYRLEIQP